MNKTKIIFIVSVFVSSTLISMPRKYLDDCQSSVDNILEMSCSASNSESYAQVALVALGVADFIKIGFLNSREFRGDVEQMIDFVRTVLDFYKKAHELFILNKQKCEPSQMPLEALKQYSLCNESVQGEFQRKVSDLFGGCELSILQWFTEMRDFEYESHLIPGGLI
jgi:hypothetical protein